jgi:hypothetical protein
MEENEKTLEEVKSEDKVVQEPQQEEKVKPDFSKFESKNDESVYKVDLTKTKNEGNADTEQEATDVVTDEQTEALQEVVEEVSSEQTAVQNEEPVVEEVKEEIKQTSKTSNDLPEGLDNLVSFMKETGGTVEDYVSLNTDYSEMDNMTALQEYYKRTKPHLSLDEINFLMEDSFSFDEEIDEEKEIKRKKLALKEQVANAKQYLEDQKSKYYTEIKTNNSLTDEQQKAVDFFNRYQKESEENQRTISERSLKFQEKTNGLFNEEFKGFKFNLGEKSFRFNVRNTDQVKETQSDINNFVKKFLDDDGNLTNAEAYHKSLYTAMNADAIAKHFYEQGKADAVKDSVANAKNIDMAPRQSLNDGVEVGGLKYKVLGDNSDSLKFKIKK